MTTQPLSYAQVAQYWVQAGGNPQAAEMAAAVADAESGLNPGTSNQKGVGLWVIPKSGTPAGSTDPTANARAAIQLSNNGTDWTRWCSTWSDNDCGCNGGSYLGSGSNALAALGQTGSYSVAGATPSSSGTGASSASTTGTTASTGTSSSAKKIILLIAVVVIIIGIFMYTQRRSGQGTPQSVSEPQAEPSA